MPDYTSTRYEVLTSPSKYSTYSTKVILDLLESKIGYPAPASLYESLGDIPKNAEPIASLPKPHSGAKRIALCLGHARSADKGARALNGVYEEDYNLKVLTLLAAELRAAGFFVKVYDFYEGSAYGSAMRWIAEKLKRDKMDLALEFHFNSASPTAKGFEFLFWHKSKVGVKVANVLQSNHNNHFGSWQKNRGAEPLGDEAHERGVLFTSLTHCPAVICEPFFGSSAEEVLFFMSDEGIESLVDSYFDGISLAVEVLS